MDYFELQETLYNYLWNKHQQDNNFTFSVRQKASKGAQKNHFIGTSKSNYFSFTCWDIPVYFPGSSADLTNFVFTVRERCLLRFQYGGMVKTQSDSQSQGDLALGYTLSDHLRGAGMPVSNYDDKNKILHYYVEFDPKGYESVEEITDAFEKLYELIAPIVDKSIAAVKIEHPEWQAGRYTDGKFKNMIHKMHTRLENLVTDTHPLPAEIEEELEADIPEIRPSYPLNTILYGPPGTGKTYHTVNKAIAIANPNFVLEGKSRKEIKDEYNRLVEQKQIQFVTFHQSMSYEDFLEGIKPLEPKEGDTFLKYRVEDGIFKRIVEQATYVPNMQEASVYLNEDEFSKAAFYSLTLAISTQPGDKAIYRYCLERNCIALNAMEGYNATNKAEAEIRTDARLYPQGEGQALAKLVHHVKPGNYVLLCDGENACRAIGRVIADYEYRPNEEITPDHFRQVEWLVKDATIPREVLYASPFTYGLERLDRTEVKKDFFTKKSVAVQPALIRKNYVLIIDEINRGNVSQIFGELITLIEEDKRKGKERHEALTVILPYSKKPFSVPDNLHLIGTMNTADRSVEALDTALRRRFTFEEMMPKPELLNSYQRLIDLWIKLKHTKGGDKEWVDAEKAFSDLYGMTFTDKEGYENLKPTSANMDEELAAIAAADFKSVVSFDGLDLEKLLHIVNERLCILLTKDHTIGHAWLMDVFSLTDLQSAFKNKILPLLQEYFYNNYGKIGLVLGNAFFEEPVQVKKGLFATFQTGSELAEDYTDKIIYSFKNPSKLVIDNFKSIYQ